MHQVALYPHQVKAIKDLRTGSVLCGGVGSGKSRTSIAYYFDIESKGSPKKDIYVITTAKKRDTLDWEREAAEFSISKDRNSSLNGVAIFVDSWNNISKYTNVSASFFIFDEQRLVGSGVWVSSFLKIAKKNNWILLSATPGDTWLDYIPLFIANGFFKNRTEFIRNHVLYKPFMKYPKIDRYINTKYLESLKSKILVVMDYEKKTVIHEENIRVNYDRESYIRLLKTRWNFEENTPTSNVSELFFLIRKVVNADPSRLDVIKTLLEKHQKLIVFYNFNYELEILRNLKTQDVDIGELNGHKHDALPTSNKWVYLVQYSSGSEAWNCIETNAIAFYSLNYSYRIMTQAAGRIDRMNTEFLNLYYYKLISRSPLDKAINRALLNKKKFNEKKYVSKYSHY